MRIDPITIAVVKGALEQTADEMDLRTVRAALSPIIAETNDMAHGIFHPETGETIAQGRFGLPIFLAVMQVTVQNVLRYVREEGGFQPGDVWLTNDPYVSGTHLQDLVLIRPYFYQGELVAVLANTGHWMDIGGMTPGGWSPQATELYQEGLIIPPIRLYERGQLNRQALKLLLANVRLPEQNLGDLEALVRSLEMGEERLNQILERYGLPVVRGCLDELIRRSEQQMRSYIAEIPDGTYEFTDYLDNDGLSRERICIHARVTVTGDEMLIDFRGTSPPNRGPLNISYNTAVSACHVALKHIFPDVPVNGGTFRPIQFIIPEGTCINAGGRRPVGGYLELVNRINDVLFGALSAAIPDRVPAASFGTVGVGVLGGVHPETGRYYVAVFPYPGGYGASRESDGLVHGTPPLSMANFMSIESSEHRYPIRFDYFALREDSGGAGYRRGGCGSRYAFTLLAEEAVISILGDRHDHPPFGVAGGGPGAVNLIRLCRGDHVLVPPMQTKVDKLPLQRGDRMEFNTPGGGGYGDPLTREPGEVERDLNHGYISRRTAEEVYGAVVMEEPGPVGPRFRVDRAATAQRRATLHKGRSAR